MTFFELSYDFFGMEDPAGLALFVYRIEYDGNDSIFRLLSPLLQIFFGIPDSKKLKTEIHQQIKDQEIDNLESLFLQFINLQKKSILS